MTITIESLEKGQVYSNCVEGENVFNHYVVGEDGSFDLLKSIDEIKSDCLKRGMSFKQQVYPMFKYGVFEGFISFVVFCEAHYDYFKNKASDEEILNFWGPMASILKVGSKETLIQKQQRPSDLATFYLYEVRTFGKDKKAIYSLECDQWHPDNFIMSSELNSLYELMNDLENLRQFDEEKED